MATPKLYTEAELARATNRTPEYLRTARSRGLIAPLGETGAGVFIYTGDAIAAVNAIQTPVLTLHRKVREMARKYRAELEAADASIRERLPASSLIREMSKVENKIRRDMQRQVGGVADVAREALEELRRSGPSAPA